MAVLTFLTQSKAVSLPQTLSHAASKLLEYKSVWMVEDDFMTTFLLNGYGAH